MAIQLLTDIRRIRTVTSLERVTIIQCVLCELLPVSLSKKVKLMPHKKLL